jgi:hypothetical protein
MSRNLSTEETVLVELGIQAQYLLQNETFVKAINTLSEQIANSILSSALPDTENRERLYMMHSCLNEIVGLLKSRVSAKDNIEAMVNEEDEDAPIKDNI